MPSGGRGNHEQEMPPVNGAAILRRSGALTAHKTAKAGSGSCGGVRPDPLRQWVGPLKRRVMPRRAFR
jgi:hypothetical protein